MSTNELTVELKVRVEMKSAHCTLAWIHITTHMRAISHTEAHGN